MGWTRKHREQSRLERKQIAKEVERGEAPADLAQKYNCSLSRVCHACNEFGVVVSKSSNFTSEGLKILYRLVYTDQPLSMIARELQCSLWRVNYVSKIAKLEGFEVMARPVGRPTKKKLERLSNSK